MKYLIKNTKHGKFFKHPRGTGLTNKKQKAALVDYDEALVIIRDSRVLEMQPFKDYESSEIISKNISEFEKNLVEELKKQPFIPVVDNKDSLVFCSHPFMDDSKKESRTELIYDVIKQTSAFKAGGIEMHVKGDKIVVHSNGELDFKAVGLFSVLGAFDVTITSDRKQRVLIVIS